jgi:aminopeptidase YwaD
MSRKYRYLTSLILPITLTAGLFTFVPSGSLATVLARNDNEAARVVKPNAVSAEELYRHIKFLASTELQGRRSGTPECERAAQYISERFREYGVGAAASTYLQPFEFIAGVKTGPQTSFKASLNGQLVDFQVGEDFAPLNFSSTGQLSGEVVLAGYGITAAGINYDDYAGVDVNGKIVMVLPFSPEGNNQQGKFADYLNIRRKAVTAREKGARAILFISESDKLQNLRLRGEDNFTDSGIIAGRIGKATANRLLAVAGKNVDDLIKVSATAGKGEHLTLSASATVQLNAEVVRERKTSHNVVGILRGNDPKLKDEYIVLGAHYDHLGLGGPESLAASRDGIHHGADDNASGVAGLLELARVFGANQQNLRRSLVFVAFSGEELGLLGSAHYVRNAPMPLANTVAMLNMDMIGRLRNDNLTVGGIGTSPQWKTLVEDLNRPRGFSLKLQEDGFGPSDHSSFYSKDIPVLFFFTGTHDEYHKPSDTPDTINVISQRAVVSYIHDITAAINQRDQRIEFSKAKVEGDRRMMNSTFRVSLGSVPEYAEGVEGVRLSGVRPGSAAEKAGVKAGDIVIELAGKKVKSVQDYTFVLQELEPNKTVPIAVLREGKRLDLQITPAPRQ